ncbi:MAG: hypothetical protein WDM89_02595 [Rhizomicrobium sp.]
MGRLATVLEDVAEFGLDFLDFPLYLIAIGLQEFGRKAAVPFNDLDRLAGCNTDDAGMKALRQIACDRKYAGV